MTESEWQTGADPAPMLAFLRRRASERKMRLFAVACSRRLLHLVTDDCGGQAVALAERLADGRAREPERAALWQRIREMGDDRVMDREFFRAALVYAMLGGIASGGNVLSAATAAARKVASILGQAESHRLLNPGAFPAESVAAEKYTPWSMLLQRKADLASQEMKRRERQFQADLLRE